MDDDHCTLYKEIVIVVDPSHPYPAAERTYITCLLKPTMDLLFLSKEKNVNYCLFTPKAKSHNDNEIFKMMDKKVFIFFEYTCCLTIW